jgi:CRISPR-associated protein Csm3
MRFLLEWKLDNKVDPDGSVHGFKIKCEDPKCCPICRVFGTANKNADLGPTRLIVRDAHLTAASQERISKEGELLTEDKYENSINRITAVANPRPLERVVPGVTFSFEMVYRKFQLSGETDDVDEKLFDTVLEGMKLVEKDGLGGAISRGSGKVEFGYTDDSGVWHPGEIKIDGEIQSLSD